MQKGLKTMHQCDCMAVELREISIDASGIFLVRAPNILPREKYHEIRSNVESDLRHAGVENPRVVVWPPDLNVSVISRYGA